MTTSSDHLNEVQALKEKLKFWSSGDNVDMQLRLVWFKIYEFCGEA